jgi:hypothetical protein
MVYYNDVKFMHVNGFYVKFRVRYHLWEDLGDDLPKLLGARLGQARDPLRKLPVVNTDKLVTDAELRRCVCTVITYVFDSFCLMICVYIYAHLYLSMHLYHDKNDTLCISSKGLIFYCAYSLTRTCGGDRSPWITFLKVIYKFIYI